MALPTGRQGNHRPANLAGSPLCSADSAAGRSQKQDNLLTRNVRQSAKAMASAGGSRPRARTSSWLACWPMVEARDDVLEVGRTSLEVHDASHVPSSEKQTRGNENASENDDHISLALGARLTLPPPLPSAEEESSADATPISSPITVVKVGGPASLASKLASQGAATPYTVSILALARHRHLARSQLTTYRHAHAPRIHFTRKCRALWTPRSRCWPNGPRQRR